MEPITGQKLGKELCEVLGIDPSFVRSISIEANCNKVAELTIVRMVSSGEMQQMKSALEKYTLKGKDPENAQSNSE